MSLSKSNANACVEGPSAPVIDAQASQCSVPTAPDWRTDFQKELADTRADFLSLSKKMDLLLELQMSGSRLNGNAQGSGIQYADVENNNRVEPAQTNVRLTGTVPPIQPSSVPEKTCSASAISEEGSERRQRNSERSKFCLPYVLFTLCALSIMLSGNHTIF